MLLRWNSFARFVSDGRIYMTNNAAEPRMRTVAVGRRNWTFRGSDRGGDRAATLYNLIQTRRLNDVDPHAWLRDVIAQISDHPQTTSRAIAVRVESSAVAPRRGRGSCVTPVAPN